MKETRVPSRPRDLRAITRLTAPGALLALLALLLASGGGVRAATQAESTDALAVAKQLHQAFNRHDPDAMAALVTEDFELYYVGPDGESALSSRGRQQLRDDMASYFASNPEVASTIAGAVDGPSFVSFREQIVGGASSLAVYEVVESLVRRAWYYPAETDP